MRVPVLEVGALGDYFTQSLDDLMAHFNEGLDGEPVLPRCHLTMCFLSPADLSKKGIFPVPQKGRAQFSAWWFLERNPDSPVETYLWDLVECVGLTRAEATEALQDLTFEVLEEASETEHWNGELVTPEIPALCRYHPHRLLSLLPFGREVANAGIRAKGIPTETLLREIQKAFFEADALSVDTAPLRNRVKKKREDERQIRRYLEMLLGYACYYGAGKQLFDIPPALSALFRKTDVDDVTWENLRLPYCAIYLHFGKQQDLSLGNGWHLEGAYINEVEHDGRRHANITVTSCPDDYENFKDFGIYVEPSYSQPLGPERMGIPLGEAVEQILSDKIAQLKQEIAGSPEVQARFKAMQAQGAPGKIAVDVTARNATQELSLLMPRHAAYLEMLKLVVNALVYISAYPKDIVTKWPRNTPAKALAQIAQTTNRNEQRKLISRLALQGYNPVHVCGERLAAELEKQAKASSPAGGTVATHWRKGHWKRQRHGPQNTLIKIIWRMPVLVSSKDEGPDAASGHIYLVS